MPLGQVFFIGVGLSMDAFAVSVCKGLSVKRLRPWQALLAGLYFGGFQFLMPLLGFLLGYRFEHWIEAFDHWIAFVLLALIGVNMIRSSFSEEDSVDDDFSFTAMIPLAVATSIDALAVGVTFAFLRVDILPASTLIGVTTFVLSALGVALGRLFGMRSRTLAQRIGGVILILIGLKILLEHLGVLNV